MHTRHAPPSSSERCSLYPRKRCTATGCDAVNVFADATSLIRQLEQLREQSALEAVSFDSGETVAHYRDRVIRAVELAGDEADYAKVYAALPNVYRSVIKATIREYSRGGTSPLKRVGKYGLRLRRRPPGVFVDDRYLSPAEMTRHALNVHGLSERTLRDRLVVLGHEPDLTALFRPSKARGKGARAT